MLISRSELLAAMDAVKGAVATKGFTPILTHVLVDNQSVMGFDSEVGIKVKLEHPTGITFNAKFETLSNLLRSLDGEELDVTIDERKRVLLKCGRHSSTLTQIEEDYPKPNVKPTNTWRPIAAGFKEALERAYLAAAESETAKVLSCVLVKGSRIYGMDGKRCVRCTVDDLDLEPMMLSRKAVAEIVRLGQPTRVMTVGPWGMFDYGNLMFLARLREGLHEYPPLDNLMEGLKLDAREQHPIPDGFVAMLTRLALFTSSVVSGPGNAVRVHPGPLGAEFTAQSESGQVVEYLEPVPGLPDKLFAPDALAQAVPYAELVAWGERSDDPIYLRGSTAGFEFLLSPMRP